MVVLAGLRSFVILCVVVQTAAKQESCGPAGCPLKDTKGTTLLQSRSSVLKRQLHEVDDDDDDASGIVASGDFAQSNSSASVDAVATTASPQPTVHCYPVESCYKKGIILPPTSQKQCNDLQLFNGHNYGWWYSWRQAPTESWSQNSDCSDLLHNTQFIPMVKNTHFTEKDELDDTWMDSPYIFGFNEPYGSHYTKTGAKQMTPQECLEGMKDVVAKAESAGRKLEVIAPSVNPKRSAMNWYKQFRDLAVKDGIWSKFKYMNAHYFTCDADKMIRKLKTVYDEFGLPIWLTEFNCNGMSDTKTTPEQHLAYMQAVLPKLEEAEYVVRYSWYTLRNGKLPGANLAQGEGQKDGWVGELTALGRWYDEYVPPNSSAQGWMGWFMSVFR